MVLSLQTSAVTLDVVSIRYAFLAKVAKAAVEAELVVTACEVKVVFLTETVAGTLLKPIVGIKCVDIAVVSHTVAKGGVRVETTVSTDQHFTFGHTVDHIAETA